PRMDRQRAVALAEAAAGRPGAAGDPFDLIVTLLDRFLSRAARAGLMGPPLPEAADREAEVLARISPDDRAARGWAAAQADLSARARRGRAVNLDPGALVLDMLLTLSQGPGATDG
ncbi:MAG TPA: DNA polymerase III subunit delta', partial [Paracoccus sp. (in: a-proteobacteria)]|nr:DNA polymerase III subunit delta' [Paracoccus sp. (in: a-proteobacteria)]